MAHIDMKENELSTAVAHISKLDNLVTVKLKSNTEINLESSQEIVRIRELLLDDAPFVTMVLMAEGNTPTKEAREYIASLNLPLGHATAFVCKYKRQEAIVDFYIKVNEPRTVTRVFETELDAIQWLKAVSPKRKRLAWNEMS
jgi:hypothetical protein